MVRNKPKKPSLVKRFAGLALVVLVVLIGFLGGQQAWRQASPPAEPEVAPKEQDHVLPALVGLVLGGLFMGAAGVAYLVTVLTDCFTFAWGKPVFSGFRLRLFFINMFVVACLAVGIALATLLFLPLSSALGLPKTVPVAACIVALVVVMVLVNPWAPVVRKLVRKRLRALGVPDEALARGIPVGISDPSAKDLFRVGGIESDVGMLWLLKDRIRYCGDRERFEVKRPDLVEIERKTDALSPTILAGALPVILRFRQGETERRVRLEPEGPWTVWGMARAWNRLANRIERWWVATPPLAAAHESAPR